MTKKEYIQPLTKITAMDGDELMINMGFGSAEVSGGNAKESNFEEFDEGNTFDEGGIFGGADSFDGEE